jgi:hypothetical protein
MAKANTNKGVLKNMKSEGKKAAKEAAYSPLMERLTRLGYGIKGMIYIFIGSLALRGAFGNSRTPADQLGAIAAISKLPYGDLILWVVLIGLISYSLWGLIRAFLDPFHKGTDMEGLVARGGFLVSAITYAFFVMPTYDLIQGTSSGSQTGNTQRTIGAVLSMPWGWAIVGILGIAGIVAGFYQIYRAINSKFDQTFKPYAMTPEQLRIAKQAGRFGTIARGVVFSLVGFFLCLAAFYSNPRQAKTFDGALDFLAKQPYGLWLMGIIAIGLIAFGIYSLLGAAWFRLKR